MSLGARAPLLPSSLLELRRRLLLLDFLQLLLPGLGLRELVERLLLGRTLDGDSLRGHPTVFRVCVRPILGHEGQLRMLAIPVHLGALDARALDPTLGAFELGVPCGASLAVKYFVAGGFIYL